MGTSTVGPAWRGDPATPRAARSPRKPRALSVLQGKQNTCPQHRPSLVRLGGGAMAIVDERWPGAPVRANPPATFDRQPPQDLAAAQSVLGGMLLSKDAIADVMESLSLNDFYKPAHSLVFDAIMSLYSRGEPADTITVAAELER